MTDWIMIEAKFPNKCILCNEQIYIGDTSYFKKGDGLKQYPEFTIGFRESYSRLIIFDEDDDL